MHRDGEKKVFDIGEIYAREKVYYFLASDNYNIVDILEKVCPENYDVEYSRGRVHDFAQIVNIGNGPIENDKGDIVSVSGFNQYELENVAKKILYTGLKRIFPGTNEAIDSVKLINNVYEAYDINMFKILSKYMHFCTVIYDYRKNCLIGGVSEPDNEYNQLFYGYYNSINNRNCKYFKDSNEIAFSNNPDILRHFCYEVHKMPNNTYMINGELHSFKKKSKDDIEVKLKEILESEYGRNLIDELVIRVNEYLSESDEIVRKLK